ncbi:MAG: M48 family metalloprotease [Chlorogloea purpurea SAG 13.99]|nr:M48 family metalloprotease [Chlorogloea purpurea SAG 13.99]
MFKKNAILALLAFVSILLLQMNLFVEAKPKPQTPAPARTQTPKTDPAFEKAKKELPEDLYIGYRIVERLARANKIDQTPWRLAIVDEYNVNAYATEINLIAIYTGLIDQLQGDVSALGFVLAHEMAHHVKRHNAIGPAQQAALKEKIQKEAEEQVNQEIQSANNEAVGTTILGGAAQVIGGLFGGWGNVAGGAVGQGTTMMAQDRVARGQKRVEEIVKEKTAELEAKIAEQSRTYEFEADEQGYKYMATAGFDPEGCMRAMTVLGRVPGSETDTSHPAVPKRIAQLEELMAQYPAKDLEKQGELRLKTIKPLSYAPSKDGKTLRINSVPGGGGGDPFDRKLSF